MEYFKDGNVSLSDFLIAFLLSGKSSYRFRQILRNRAFKRAKEASLMTTLYRLQKRGVLNNVDGDWSIAKGYKPVPFRTYSYIPSPFKSSAPDSLLVCFDIPESQNQTRRWLRNQLKIFGYPMIQKSLWVGPGPLPPAFEERLVALKIKQCIKKFKLAPNQKI